jgi:hypothetical protein
VSEVGTLAPPVLPLAPPTGAITVTEEAGGVEKVKLADVAVPAESVETAA